jgi:hypothetical protein
VAGDTRDAPASPASASAAGLWANLEAYSWTNKRPVMGHRLVTLLRSNSVAASAGGAFG